MTADYEHSWLLREARRALSDACHGRDGERHVVAVQQAQACVEYCARAVIATYQEPSWGHSHATDLERMLLAHGGDILRRFGRGALQDLRRLAADDREMAPWHTRTVYGVRVADGSVRSPGEVCTPEVAARALFLAERSLTAVDAFLAAWRPPGEQ